MRSGVRMHHKQNFCPRDVDRWSAVCHFMNVDIASATQKTGHVLTAKRMANRRRSVRKCRCISDLRNFVLKSRKDRRLLQTTSLLDFIFFRLPLTTTHQSISHVTNREDCVTKWSRRMVSPECHFIARRQRPKIDNQ